MKTKYIFVSVLLSAMTFAGCVDMDTYPEGDIITQDQKDEVVGDDPSKAEAGVTAIFAQYSAYQTVVARHNDFGYPAVMLFTDTNGHDVVSEDNGYNWAGYDLDFSDRNYAGNEAKIVWHTLYQMVYAANNVVASINPETKDEPSAKFYLGQALAARAFDYWVLAQLYQFNYVDHKTALCVPIITEENMKEAPVDGCPRATVEEVYTQIISDIDTAIELLKSAQEDGQRRIDKRYVDLSVAYGLRARIHLTMEKWAEAAADAKEAINLSPATPYSVQAVSVPTMYDSNDASWMWGIVISESDRVVTSVLVNWPSHMGTFNYGYSNYSGGRQINKKLWKAIPESDVRKGWWVDESLKSKNLNDDYQDMIVEYGYPAYTQVKFAPYKEVVETTVNANDIPLMRIEEMYLIKAEGEAMSGKLSEAKATLESFVKAYRDPSFASKATSQEGVQEEVYFQRRVEFWGEGLSWFDIMRLKKPVDRRGGGYPDETMIFNISAGDNILLWRIPETEVQSNPLLKPEDNNPAAPFPTPVKDVE